MQETMQTEMMYIKNTRPHFHLNELEIVLVLQGSLTLYKMERQEILNEGDMTFINRRIVHYFQSEGAYILSTKISLANFKNIFERIEDVEFFYEAKGEEDVAQRKRMLVIDAMIKDFQMQSKSYLENEKTFNANQLVFLLFSSFQLIFTRRKEEYITEDLSNRYYFIVSYVFEHINEKIVIDDLLPYVYMSPTYFSQFMKKMGGVGFKEFVSYRKLMMILTYLIDQNLPMTSIASAVGMSDMKSFYGVFKRYFGISPAKWREQVRQLKDDYALCHDDYILGHFIERYHIHRHRDNTIAKLYQYLVIEQTNGLNLEDVMVVLNPYQDMGVDYDEDYQVYKYFGVLVHQIRKMRARLVLFLPFTYLVSPSSQELLCFVLKSMLMQYGLNELKKWQIIIAVEKMGDFQKAEKLKQEMLQWIKGLHVELSIHPLGR